jgi:hypothetical protein
MKYISCSHFLVRVSCSFSFPSGTVFVLVLVLVLSLDDVLMMCFINVVPPRNAASSKIKVSGFRRPSAARAKKLLLQITDGIRD